MKTNLIWGLIVCFALGVGFFLGRSSSGGKSGQAKDGQALTQSTKSNSAIRAGKEKQASDAGLSWPAIAVRRMLEGKEDDPDAILEAASRAFEFKDPVEKEMALVEVLSFVSSVEGMLAVQEAFTKEKREKGKDHGGLFNLFLYRSGQNLGPTAVEEFGGKGEFNKEKSALKGWASNEPGKALDYYYRCRDQVSDFWEANMLKGIVNASVLSEPYNAETLLFSLSEEDQLSCLDNFCAALSEAEGVEGMMSYYQTLTSRSDDLESPLVHRSRWKVLERLNFATHGGGSEGMATYLQGVQEMNQMAPFSVEEFGRMGRSFTRADGLTNRLQFLEGINRDLAIGGEELQKAVQLSFSNGVGEEDIEQLHQWANENPESPIAEGVNRVLGN